MLDDLLKKTDCAEAARYLFSSCFKELKVRNKSAEAFSFETCSDVGKSTGI